jgi:hypothetical protein
MLLAASREVAAAFSVPQQELPLSRCSFVMSVSFCIDLYSLLKNALNYDDLVKSPVSHEATEITKRILNIFNKLFFVPLWRPVKLLVLTTASNYDKGLYIKILRLSNPCHRFSLRALRLA